MGHQSPAPATPKPPTTTPKPPTATPTAHQPPQSAAPRARVPPTSGQVCRTRPWAVPSFGGQAQAHGAEWGQRLAAVVAVWGGGHAAVGQQQEADHANGEREGPPGGGQAVRQGSTAGAWGTGAG